MSRPTVVVIIVRVKLSVKLCIMQISLLYLVINAVIAYLIDTKHE